MISKLVALSETTVLLRDPHGPGGPRISAKTLGDPHPWTQRLYPAWGPVASGWLPPGIPLLVPTCPYGPSIPVAKATQGHTTDTNMTEAALDLAGWRQSPARSWADMHA